MSPEKIKLINVQETLLLPLWGRFVENQKEKPLLVDDKAVEIIRNMDYDFAKFTDLVNPLSRAAWIARSIYFDEAEVKRLFSKIEDEFTKAILAFDYSSVKGLEITNKKVLKESGLSDEARAKWGTDNIYEIETWQAGIKIIETMNLFAKHRKKFPLWKRIGMAISDHMKIMSLAKIEINGA